MMMMMMMMMMMTMPTIQHLDIQRLGNRQGRGQECEKRGAEQRLFSNDAGLGFRA